MGENAGPRRSLAGIALADPALVARELAVLTAGPDIELVTPARRLPATDVAALALYGLGREGARAVADHLAPTIKRDVIVRLRELGPSAPAGLVDAAVTHVLTLVRAAPVAAPAAVPAETSPETGDAGPGFPVPPFIALVAQPAPLVAAALEEEWPPVIALALSFMPPSRAAQILAAMGDRDRAAEAALALTRVDHGDDELVRFYEQRVLRRMAALEQRSTYDGTAFLARVLSSAPGQGLHDVVARIEQSDPRTHRRVQLERLTIERLEHLRNDDLARVLSTFLSSADTTAGSAVQQLAVACKLLPAGLVARILAILPADAQSEAGEYLQERYRTSLVREQQARLVAVARSLAGQGHIDLTPALEAVTAEDDHLV